MKSLLVMIMLGMTIFSNYSFASAMNTTGEGRGFNAKSLAKEDARKNATVICQNEGWSGSFEVLELSYDCEGSFIAKKCVAVLYFLCN